MTITKAYSDQYPAALKFFNLVRSVEKYPTKKQSTFGVENVFHQLSAWLEINSFFPSRNFKFLPHVPYGLVISHHQSSRCCISLFVRFLVRSAQPPTESPGAAPRRVSLTHARRSKSISKSNNIIDSWGRRRLKGGSHQQDYCPSAESPEIAHLLEVVVVVERQPAAPKRRHKTSIISKTATDLIPPWGVPQSLEFIPRSWSILPGSDQNIHSSS